MVDPAADLSADERAIVTEEEALLARVRLSLDRARERALRRAVESTAAADEALRSLRDEAVASSAEDLPPLLHEMSVRQRLAERRSQHRLPPAAAPYIAHLRVDEGKGPDDYLLGHVTFVDAAEGIRIVDWRVAPVARIFYRYREGDRFEEAFPGRVAEGIVVARRILVIQDGALWRIVGDCVLLERERNGRWRASNRAALSLQTGGAETAARPGILGVGIGTSARTKPAEITALLDPEQYAAVSAPPDQPLLVLGSAGSGKTTVALHRLARIAAVEPRRYPLSGATVVVPEEGLARLSRRLLEPLGVGASHVKTAEAWITELARRVFRRPIEVCFDAPPLVSSLKRHPALHRAILSRSGAAEPSLKLAPLRRGLAEAFTDREFLSAVVGASSGDLPTTAIEETVRHTLLQLAEPLDRQLESVTDPERRRAIDGRAIAEGTPDALAGTLDVEDLPILLMLRGVAAALGATPIALLVIDEAEDFSLFELSVLGRQLSKAGSVTLAGDEAQQTASSFADWPTSVATLGVREAQTVRLPVSYRCPRPVAALARRLLGSLAPQDPVHAAREGAPVGIFRLPTEAQAQLFLAGALRDLVDREPRASIGVVAATPDAARRVHSVIADMPEARLVLHGEFSFEPGIDVTDVDNVKGLEFDYIVVPDGTAAAYPLADEARHRLHVAVTRAAHQLWIVAGGAASPLLAGEG
ncbi:MAG: ATP-binding domain-containing protein [Candidatus Binatia bacterium]